jgi:hypothetical protein
MRDAGVIVLAFILGSATLRHKSRCQTHQPCSKGRSLPFRQSGLLQTF